MTFPVQPVRKSFQYGQHEVVLETGHMARQATAAVVVSICLLYTSPSPRD